MVNVYSSFKVSLDPDIFILTNIYIYIYYRQAMNAKGLGIIKSKRGVSAK